MKYRDAVARAIETLWAGQTLAEASDIYS